MGLLNTIDRLTPGDLTGLLGRLTGYGQPQADYSSASPGFDPAPAPAPQPMPAPQRQPSGLGAFLRIPGALGGAILDDLQSGPRDRQMAAQRQADFQKALGQLGGSATPQPPVAAGPMGAGVGVSPGAPQAQPAGRMMGLREAAPLILQMQGARYKTDDIVSLLDKVSPNIKISPDGQPYDERDPATMNRRFANRTNINGFVTDLNNPESEGKYMPKLPDGAVPLYDRQGNVVAAQLLDGTTQAIGQSAEAQAAGTARGQAPYQRVTVKGPNGEDVNMSGEAARGHVFTGQSPAEATVAASGAQAQIDLPKVIAGSDQTLAIIQSLRQSPALKMRTGMYSLAPAIPGTEGANFDALAEQLKGKIFMEAFVSLKGAGQITEKEGEKATNAYARLNRAQSSEAYDQALGDLEEVIKAGKDRAMQAAQRGPGARQPSSGGNLPSLADIDAAIARKTKGRR